MKLLACAAFAVVLLAGPAMAATVDPYGLVEVSAGANRGIILKNNSDSAGTVDVEFIAGDPLGGGGGGGGIRAPFLIMDGTLRVTVGGLGSYRMLVKRAYDRPCIAARSCGRRLLNERSLRVQRSRKRAMDYRPVGTIDCGGRASPPPDMLRNGRLRGRIGCYGVDTTNRCVWAVVDVDGDYAIGGLIPEPVSLATLLAGISCLAWARRRS